MDCLQQHWAEKILQQRKQSGPQLATPKKVMPYVWWDWKVLEGIVYCVEDIVYAMEAIVYCEFPSIKQLIRINASNWTY